MFRLKLDSRQCLCCGICQDVCDRDALAMRAWRSKTVEGSYCLSALRVSAGVAWAPLATMSFPYMAAPDRCDGCMRCVHECPSGAIGITARGNGVLVESPKPG